MTAETEGGGPQSSELDLTPRESLDLQSSDKPRRWRNWVIVLVLGLAVSVVLYQALSAAQVYFLNVDEAVARRSALADSTFRMQGTVVDEPQYLEDGSIRFTIGFGGVEAAVEHFGAEPSGLFRTGEAVVAEGNWVGEQFESTRLLVKHSEEYVEDYPERVEADPAAMK